MKDEKEIGIVLFTEIVDIKEEGVNGRGGFVIVGINPEHRGNGYAVMAEDLLARKYDVDVLYATVKKDNKKSTNAHSKLGFKEIPNDLREKLLKINKLQANESRFFKIVNNEIEINKLHGASIGLPVPLKLKEE